MSELFTDSEEVNVVDVVENSKKRVVRGEVTAKVTVSPEFLQKLRNASKVAGFDGHPDFLSDLLKKTLFAPEFVSYIENCSKMFEADPKKYKKASLDLSKIDVATLSPEEKKKVAEKAAKTAERSKLAMAKLQREIAEMEALAKISDIDLDN